ncbi:protein lin-28 homolog isoform X2 [Pecten maximus]|uniref:protein lin-28 homolog isoform X2 n=1 Tax=Pecten maximus TaxID=6579 RepID=UPI001457EBAC|nr:protein lin-28 homolog isoform X2 [Pecten maximus]
MKDFATAPTQQSYPNLSNLVTKGVSWNQTSGSYMILGQPILPAFGAGGGGRRRGRCKWFNVAKGWGFVTPDDGTQDVFVHQSVVHKSGFRSLADGEEVEFESKPSDKGVEATFVCGPSGSECRGSDRRPLSRKKFRKIRCYNCGDLGNHIAAKCPHGPLPKRCHNCKSVDHLIADCPMKEPLKRSRNDTNGGGASGMGNGHDTDHGSNMFYPV